MCRDHWERLTSVSLRLRGFSLQESDAEDRILMARPQDTPATLGGPANAASPGTSRPLMGSHLLHTSEISLGFDNSRLWLSTLVSKLIYS